MTKDELTKKHEIHDMYDETWIFNQKAYTGGRRFIDEVINRNERESPKNAILRRDEAVNFNYTKEIVDLFNFYLTEKVPTRSVAGLENDKQWNMFVKNANLYGANLNSFLNSAQKKASVCGTSGILVNKPVTKSNSIAFEIANNIYPYCAMYTMPNILDWKYEVNETTGIPQLSYLKLLGVDGVYLIFRIGEWQRWAINPEGSNDEVKMISSGTNNLDIIPWVWLKNVEGDDLPYLGASDIDDIALINASIIRNISCGEEVIKWAAFPMYRKPMEAEGSESANNAGVTNVIEFDPSLKDGKPDWLESAAKEPIDAILAWIDRKIEELHRTSHLSGVHGQRKNQEATSGLALKYEFQQLISILSKKSSNLDDAEREIIKIWSLWQNKNPGDIQIKRSKNFSIDDLQIDLNNSLTAMRNVASKTFRIKVQQKMAKKELPDITDNIRKIIDDEITDSGGVLIGDSVKQPEKDQNTDV